MGLIERLTGFVEDIKDSQRPELPVQEEILAREGEFNRWDSGRVQWLLEHTYLSEGDLNVLKNHPNYHSARVEDRFSYFKSVKGGKRSRKVIVSVPLVGTEDESYVDAERSLKLSLHNRDCNAGVFYKHYRVGENVFAEATPAILTCE